MVKIFSLKINLIGIYFAVSYPNKFAVSVALIIIWSNASNPKRKMRYLYMTINTLVDLHL